MLNVPTLILKMNEAAIVIKLISLKILITSTIFHQNYNSFSITDRRGSSGNNVSITH